jgi:hypothetical protein
MSTLFDSGGAYVFYPATSYMNGDKTFGELDKGDFIYLRVGQTFKEIEVRGKLKKYKGRLLLPISGLHKERNIDFGPVNCHNVIVDAPKNSMVSHYFGLIGTNKKSILTTHLNNAIMEHKTMTEQLEQIKTKIDNLTSMLETEMLETEA